MCRCPERARGSLECRTTLTRGIFYYTMFYQTVEGAAPALPVFGSDADPKPTQTLQCLRGVDYLIAFFNEPDSRDNFQRCLDLNITSLMSMPNRKVDQDEAIANLMVFKFFVDKFCEAFNFENNVIEERLGDPWPTIYEMIEYENAGIRERIMSKGANVDEK